MRLGKSVVLRSWSGPMLLVTISGLACGVAWRLLSSPAVVLGQGNWKPYTATVMTKDYGKDGVEIGSSSRVVAVREDGSRSTTSKRYRKLANGTLDSIEHTEIVDLTRLQTVNIRPEIGSKSTTSITPDRARLLSATPEATCAAPGRVVDVDPEPAAILGFTVVKRTATYQVKDLGTRSLEEWVAPSLDCLIMRSVGEAVDKGGSVVSRTVSEVANVTLGTSSVNVFQVPPGLREMSPSQVMTAELALRGRDFCCGNFMVGVRADQAYYSDRPK